MLWLLEERKNVSWARDTKPSWTRFTDSDSACVYTCKLNVTLVFCGYWPKNSPTEMKSPCSGSLGGYELIWCSRSWVPGCSEINIWDIQRDPRIIRSGCLFVSVGLNTALLFVPVSLFAHIFSASIFTFDMCVLVCVQPYLWRRQCGSARHQVSRHKPYPPPLFVFTRTDQTWHHTASMHYMMN